MKTFFISLVFFGLLIANIKATINQNRTDKNFGVVAEALNTLEARISKQESSMKILQQELPILSAGSVDELSLGKPLVKGPASYYSEDGCLGCDPERIMANGEKLNDELKTIAVVCKSEVDRERCVPSIPLNTQVIVANTKTGFATPAMVTDTFGGVKGRVADLSVKVWDILECSGECPVEIYAMPVPVSPADNRF